MSTDAAPLPSPPEGRGASHDAVRRRRGTLAAGVLALVGIALVLAAGSSSAGPDTGAATLVPADALAYVNVSLDSGRAPVRQALAVARRLPTFALAAAAVQGRLSALLSGGQGADYRTRVRPWIGDEAALALLDTATTTAGSLLVIDLRDRARARAFLRAEGASPRGAYRGTPLLGYPTGSEIAFVSHYLVLGQDASVRAALDVAAGATASLASSAVYRRAAAGELPDRVLDAYASLAGVRRLLAPRGGLIGAFATLIYQPALQGAALSLVPAAAGVRIRIRAVLDPSLVKLSPPATRPFSPTLQRVMPSGAVAMADVMDLPAIAGRVLSAGAVARVAGGVGPLLSRLGAALSSEGVDVHAITGIFGGETAVAIVPRDSSSTLVIVTRTAHPAAVRTALAELEVPLAQLFTPSGSSSGRVPVFNDRSTGGVTARQVVLAPGLELDYAIFRGLVVISTSLDGVGSVAQRVRSLAEDPAYRAVLGSHPSRVTGLVYLDLPRLLTLGISAGLTSGAGFRRLEPDLDQLTAVGFTTTRGPDRADTVIDVRVR